MAPVLNSVATAARTVARPTSQVATRPSTAHVGALRIARPLVASRRAVVVRAAASGAAGEDPYQVLGLRAGATSEEVQKKYNYMKREATMKGDDDTISKIEAAHTTIMMSQLTSRMKGGVTIPKEVAYADKAVLFPWRPRVAVEEKKAILRNLIVAAVVLLWAVVGSQNAHTQPLFVSAALCIGAQYFKQGRFFPTGGRYPSPEEKKNNGRNILRAFGLGLFGMFSGIFIFYTAPDLIFTQLNKTLPYWFYESQSLLLNTGGIIMNFVTASFLR